MTRKQIVRAIVLNDDKLLTMRRDKFGTQYYTLIGGAVDIGEDLEAALRRELREETGLEVGTMRPVFMEDAGEMYGVQYVFLCEYKGGEPHLSTGTDEAAITAMGKNIYDPVWLPVSELMNVTFRSTSVRDAVLEGVRGGFPETPRELAWKA